MARYFQRKKPRLLPHHWASICAACLRTRHSKTALDVKSVLELQYSMIFHWFSKSLRRIGLLLALPRLPVRLLRFRLANDPGEAARQRTLSHLCFSTGGVPPSGTYQVIVGRECS